MREYAGKTIYIGIDVHKKTYFITAICDGSVIKKCSLTADPSGFISFCRKQFPDAFIISAYEAGFSGFDLHWQLEKEENFRSLVVHAASIEVAARPRNKTDKRDSLKIATQLATGRLQSIHIPAPERVDFRHLTRQRQAFVKKRKRTGSQMKALLFQLGYIPYDDNRVVSAKWIRSWCAKKIGYPYFQKCFFNYAKDWFHADKIIKELDKEIEDQSVQDSLIDSIIRTAPGVGPVIARTLANELGDMSQFKNERQLFSFLGLAPSEHSSGDQKHLGSITRQGNPDLRKLLIQASWLAIKRDKSLNDIFDRISVKGGSGRAIVAIARRLIGRIRACLTSKIMYK